MATRHPYMGVIFKLGTLCSTMVTHVNITVLIQAFGTMAILCPLMVPIAYKLTGDETTIVHTSAAILFKNDTHIRVSGCHENLSSYWLSK